MAVVTAPLHVVWDTAALSRLGRDLAGPVGRDLARRGERVRDAARAQVRIGAPDPLRPKVGPHLRDTITSHVFADARGLVARVGSDAPTALLHHEGTRPHEIVPRTARVLRFHWPKAGRVVYLRRVQHPGTRPNRYLTDNLRRAAE